MTHAPKRRWSYSLRTLFVVVTVFACWLGYHVNWIKKRDDARAWVDAHPCGGALGGIQDEWRPGISWSLWVLGEKAAPTKLFLASYDTGKGADDDLRLYRDRVQEIIRLFPESQIIDCEEGYYPDQLNAQPSDCSTIVPDSFFPSRTDITTQNTIRASTMVESKVSGKSSLENEKAPYPTGEQGLFSR